MGLGRPRFWGMAGADLSAGAGEPLGHKEKRMRQGRGENDTGTQNAGRKQIFSVTMLNTFIIAKLRNGFSPQGRAGGLAQKR